MFPRPEASSLGLEPSRLGGSVDRGKRSEGRCAGACQGRFYPVPPAGGRVGRQRGSGLPKVRWHPVLSLRLGNRSFNAGESVSTLCIRRGGVVLRGRKRDLCPVFEERDQDWEMD